MNHAKVLTKLVLIGAVLAGCSSDDSAAPPGVGGSTGAGTGGSKGTGGGSAGASTGGGGSTAQSDAGTGGGEVTSDGGCTHPKGASCTADGGYRCPAYATDICDNTCVDMMSNPDYCGTCTTKCAATAACVAGKCGTAPSAFVASAAGCDVIHLAIAAGTLYWADKGHGTIKGMPTAGGAAVSVASGQMAPTQLVVDAGTAFWINSGSKTISKAPVGGGGAVTVLVTSQANADAGVATAPDITALTVSNATVYFATANQKIGVDLVYGIFKVPAAGGAPTLIGLAQQNGVPKALAIDAKYAYYTTDVHNDVEFMNLVASGDAGVGFNARELDDLSQKMFRVAESQGSLFYDNIVVVGPAVYWANSGALMVGKPDGLRAGKPLGATTFSGAVTGFGIGSSNAYFGEDGFVEKASLTLGDAAQTDGIPIARAQPSPSSFAFDATNVYWATGTSAVMVGDGGADPNACAIMKQAM